MPLRVRSYLSPSVPDALFVAIAESLQSSLGLSVELEFETSYSGPRPGQWDDFAGARVDLAFVCATSYVWSLCEIDPPLRLLGTAFVPSDPRAHGQPVYFGDVLATSDGPASLGDLRGRRIAFNDEVSLSGYQSLRVALATLGIGERDVDWRRSGSHLESLGLLIDRVVDLAVVDSNVWRRVVREKPRTFGRLCHIAELGPYPAQPAVVPRSLPSALRRELRTAMMGLAADPHVRSAMTAAELVDVGTVVAEDFAQLRTQVMLEDQGRWASFRSAPVGPSDRASQT